VDLVGPFEDLFPRTPDTLEGASQAVGGQPQGTTNQAHVGPRMKFTHLGGLNSNRAPWDDYRGAMHHGGRRATAAFVAILALTATLSACTGRDRGQSAAGPVPATPEPTTSQSPPPATPERRARPNVLLLLTDDEAAGDMRVMSKTAKSLGRSGTQFTRAFSSYPLCCPARATILSGQEAHNHHVMGNEPPWGGVGKFNDKETLPVWLQRAGYQTATLGKYLHGFPELTGATYVPPGWDEWHVPAYDIYDYYNYTLSENGKLKRYSGIYQTDFVRDQAKSLVKDLAANQKPFFLWVNFLAPHVGLPVEPDDPRAIYGNRTVDTPAVSDKYRDAMLGTQVPRTPALNERNVSDKGQFIRDLKGRNPLALDEVYQQRLESLLSVDDAVKSILDELKRTGEYDNTVIVFASDNGYALGQHRWVSKILGYEESIRVPLFITGPGIARGVRRNQQVSLADLTATFLDVAHARSTLPPDGISLLPLSNDPAKAARRAMLLEAGGWPDPGLDRLYTGVRTADDRVLLRWFDGFEEVYDLKTDPYQLNGRINPGEQPWVQKLRDDLARLKDCRGFECSTVRDP
jgi:N-acetylglucosamine-6-sulfatase